MNADYRIGKDRQFRRLNQTICSTLAIEGVLGRAVGADTYQTQGRRRRLAQESSLPGLTGRGQLERLPVNAPHRVDARRPAARRENQLGARVAVRGRLAAWRRATERG